MDSRTHTDAFRKDSVEPVAVERNVFMIKMIKAISVAERVRYVKAKAEKAARITKKSNLKNLKDKKLEKVMYGTCCSTHHDKEHANSHSHEEDNDCLVRWALNQCTRKPKNTASEHGRNSFRPSFRI